MAKPEWGIKRTCSTCGARFYDLRRDPIVCPVCNAVYDPERLPRPRRSGPLPREERVSVPADRTDELAEDEEIAGEGAVEAEIEDLEESEEDEPERDPEERELIEDTSELGEDDDDIGEVMEHVDENADEKP